jgi:hypothetical protein
MPRSTRPGPIGAAVPRSSNRQLNMRLGRVGDELSGGAGVVRLSNSYESGRLALGARHQCSSPRRSPESLLPPSRVDDDATTL